MAAEYKLTQKGKTEMKTNDVFPSKYLKAEDDAFENGDLTATIKDVVKEQLGQGKDEKPVMYFREFAKGLVVNKTNWATCEKLFSSDDSDDWIGQKVAMYVTEVDSFGDVVKAIRIRATKPANKQALIERFSKLYEKGLQLKIEGIENYIIAPNMPEDEIIQLGKELKAKIEAAEQF